MSSNGSLFFGGKAGGSTYRNRPDNLRSTDTFEAILGVAGVRARLAPGGLKNLFIDNVPVEDSEGNASFTEFSADVFDGDPTVLQPIQLKLGQSAGPVAVNLTLNNSYTAAPGDWKNGAIIIPGADFIDLRFVVQQLYAQTKTGISDQTASIEIQMRPSGASTWINPLVSVAAPTYSTEGIELDSFRRVFAPASYWDTATTWAEPAPGYLQITGKTNSAYVKEIRIAVPDTGAYASKTWEVRCRLIEKDYLLSGLDNENEDRRTIQWESLTAVNSEKLGGIEQWRGLATVQIYGKASDQISGIPEVTGVFDLATQLVPPATVWNPTTRLYTGTAWDGSTYVNSWTQCPAWQMKGVIEDSLSGISALAPGSTLNKWDTLEASKWFSELVPDGKGGTHPRYSANWFLEQPMQVHELVNYLAGAVGGRAWDEGDGRWRLKVERPENPVMIFTRENIVGEFIYNHTDIDTRYNDFTGVFRNAENRYEEDRVRDFDQDDIDLTGRRHTTVALVGCVNRQEALRRIHIRRLSALNETRIVNFTTNRVGSVISPLSVIAIADGDMLNDTTIRSTGRITTMNGARTEITVRDTIRLEVGVAYTVTFTVPNPAYVPDTLTQPSSNDWNKPTITITRTITNTAGQRGDVTTLYLDTALPADTPLFAPLALSATGLPSLPKQYRVVNVKPSDDGMLWSISAIEIYTSKWAEADAITEDEVNAQISLSVVPPPLAPSTGIFDLLSYPTEFVNRRSLIVNWDRPGSMFIDKYRLNYSFNGGPWTALGDTRDTFHELADPIEGDYIFRIYTLDRRGNISLPLIGTLTIDETFAIAPTYTLTNGAVAVNANAAGTVASFAGTGGTYRVFTPAGQVTTGVVYSLVSVTGGLSITIDASTGVYTPTALTSDYGTAVFRATFEGVSYDQVYTITKARDGVAGVSGLNVASIFLYQRSASTPAVPSTTSTYTFTTGVLTGHNNGWTQNVPAGSNPLYITIATASSTGATDTLSNTEWAAPTILAQDGTNGTNGTNGLNNALIYIYQRAASAPTLPSATTTFTFATAGLTGLNNGWTSAIPGGADPLYVSVATASSTGATDTVASGEWAAATVLAQNGTNGTNGTNGLNSATAYIYQRAASSPTLPSVTATYTFSTNSLTGLNNGWLSTIPAGTNPLYVSTAPASSTGATDTIGTAEWNAVAVLSQNGTNGTNGTDGLNAATVYVYQRAAAAPTLPSATTTYTFSTGGLTGLNNGWTTTIPVGTNPLYVTKAVAAASTATDTIGAGEWAAAVILAQDGAPAITFRQGTTPTATKVGDLWIDTANGNKAYYWTGSAWTSIQDSGALYASLGLNSDGTVANNKVVSNSIVDGSVTTQGASYTAGTINMSTTDQIVQSLTITTTGDPVLLIYSLEWVQLTDNEPCFSSLYRGGTPLVTLDKIPVNNGDNPTTCIVYVDQPVAGTYTYYVYGRLESGATGQCGARYRSLAVLEIRK